MKRPTFTSELIMYSFCWSLFPLTVLAAQHPLINTHSQTRSKHDGIPITESILRLTFDDLPTPPDGLGPVPSSYHPPLIFPGFSLFRPTHPSLSFYISPHDHNCATSFPHAILGSRYRPASSFASVSSSSSSSNRDDSNPSELTVPSIQLISPPPLSSDIKGMRPGLYHNQQQQHHRTFELTSLSIKPLIFPPGAETVITFAGYQSNNEPPSFSSDSDDCQPDLLTSLSFPAGYHLPIHLNISELPLKHQHTDADEESRGGRGQSNPILSSKTRRKEAGNGQVEDNDNVHVNINHNNQWTNLRKVEIWADYGYGNEYRNRKRSSNGDDVDDVDDDDDDSGLVDWEFCIDDLIISIE